MAPSSELLQSLVIGKFELDDQYGISESAVSGKVLEEGCQDFGLVDRDVVAARDRFRLPRAVGAALLEETVKRRHFEEAKLRKVAIPSSVASISLPKQTEESTR